MSTWTRRQFNRACATGLASLWGCSSPKMLAQRSEQSPIPIRDFSRGAVPIQAEEYRARRKRVAELLRETGQRAFVCESGTTMTYLTGGVWRRSERPLLLVVTERAEHFWVGPGFEQGTLKERAVADGELLLWQEDESPYKIALGRLGKSRQLAIEPTTRHFVSSGLARNGAEITSGATITNAVRMTKSAAELSLLETANIATKTAIKWVHSQVRPGMTENDVRDAIVEAQATAGLKNIWALVGFSENAAFPHGTKKSRALRDGDLVLIDTGGSLHGYQSDVTRTWPVGRVSEEKRRAWNAVLRAQKAGLSELRPGARCGDVDRKARMTIEQAGFGEGYEAFTHRLGHGIGMDGHEAPYLVRGNELRLTPGMTMSVEPGIYLPGRFGIRIEDIIVITSSGYKVLGEPIESFEQPV